MEYKCTVKTPEGKKINRVMVAESPAQVVSRFKAEGLLPLKINKVKPTNGNGKRRSFFAGGRVRSKELAIFTRQLGVTLTAGLLLTEALEAIGKDLEKSALQLKVVIEYSITSANRNGPHKGIR